MTEHQKNPAAVELGRRGGLKGGPARAASLSAERRSEIGRRGIEARWQRDRDRPAIHSVVKSMQIAILAHRKPHVLFLERGNARFVAADDSLAERWRAMTPECVVGTYGPGATFTDIMSDVLAT